MKRGVLWVVATGIFLAATGVATAQPGQGGGRGGQRGMMGGGMMRGGLFMLRIPEVQQELKMTQPQIDKLDAKQQEVQQAMMQIMQDAGGMQQIQQMNPEEREKLMDKGQAVQLKAVSDILDSKQLVRFKQLELQQLGPAAVLRKDVAVEIKLTPEQKQKVQAIQQQANEERQSMFQGFRDATPEERQKMGEKMQEMQKANNEKILAVLTEAQQKQWKTMTGDPFKFPPMRMGGRRQRQ